MVVGLCVALVYNLLAAICSINNVSSLFMWISLSSCVLYTLSPIVHPVQAEVQAPSYPIPTVV